MPSESIVLRPGLERESARSRRAVDRGQNVPPPGFPPVHDQNDIPLPLFGSPAPATRPRTAGIVAFATWPGNCSDRDQRVTAR